MFLWHKDWWNDCCHGTITSHIYYLCSKETPRIGVLNQENIFQKVKLYLFHIINIQYFFLLKVNHNSSIYLVCVNLSDASFLLPGHWFDMFIAFFLGKRENKKNEQIVPKLVLQFCSSTIQMKWPNGRSYACSNNIAT